MRYYIRIRVSENIKKRFRIFYSIFSPFFGKKIANRVVIKIISLADSLGISPYLGKRLDYLASYGEMRCYFL